VDAAALPPEKNLPYPSSTPFKLSYLLCIHTFLFCYIPLTHTCPHLPTFTPLHCQPAALVTTPPLQPASSGAATFLARLVGLAGSAPPAMPSPRLYPTPSHRHTRFAHYDCRCASATPPFYAILAYPSDTSLVILPMDGRMEAGHWIATTGTDSSTAAGNNRAFARQLRVGLPVAERTCLRRRRLIRRPPATYHSGHGLLAQFHYSGRTCVSLSGTYTPLPAFPP